MPFLSPSDESDRLIALARYGILDTLPETNFDRLTALASRLFAMPIALVSLVDQDRLWFKSCVGVNVNSLNRDQAFCDMTIRSEEVLVIPDSHQDPRFCHAPLVTGEPFIRFYAGAPLVTSDGFRLGSFCLLDTVPREFGPAQVADLRDLAAVVMETLEARLTTRSIAEASRERQVAEARKQAVLDAAPRTRTH